MSIYVRPRQDGATVFFTVAVAQRGTSLLLDHIDLLRDAVRLTRQERPFRIDAWVVLPDHLHAVWTLPPGDSAYAVRWGSIKARVTMGLRKRAAGRPGFSPALQLPSDLPRVRSGRYAGLKPGLRAEKREAAVWQRRFWEHHCRDDRDVETHIRYCWGNPIKHGLVERATDWEASSIHLDIRLGRVDPEWSDVVLDGAYGEVA